MLLTPGPYSETYFEHAYLARYLGLPLVEGGDLVVRDERLFLKTVEGLEPVHGMLRRLDDDWCDPLELRADSALGVPGLLQAVRAGNLVMANALGSGFLETPALLGLPARHRAAAARPGAAAAVAAHLVVRRGGGLARRQAASCTTRWCAAPSRSGGRVSAVRHPDAAQIEDDPDAWTLTERLQLLARTGVERRHRHGAPRAWCACMPSPKATAAGSCCPAA